MGKRVMWIMVVVVAAALGGCGQVEVASVPQVDTLSAQSAKITIPHYKNGVMTGRFHTISVEEYDAIVNAIIMAGGDPSPQNVDAVLDRR
jgi:hypothetical protein